MRKSDSALNKVHIFRPEQTYHVYVPFMLQMQDLRPCQSSIAKHPNLSRQKVPGTRRPPRLQLRPHRLSDPREARTHNAQFTLPLRKELLVIQNTARNTRPVDRGIRDLGSLQDRKLSSYATAGLRCIIPRGSYKMESPDSFPVEPEILGEGLRDAAFQSLLHEIPTGPCVAGEISGCEALVCAVEEGEVAAVAHDGGDLFPFFLSRIYTCGVMGAGLKDDYRGARGVL